MQKYLFLYALAATLLAAWAIRHDRTENQRLRENQIALTTRVEYYRTEAERSAASSQVLQLRLDEFKRLHSEDARALKALGLRLRRVESTSKSVTQSTVNVRVPIYDTIFRTRDTVRLFRWHDPWVEIEGELTRNSVACRIRSTDTLRQTVYRIPHRFLFIRWGTRALRQQIVSSNPHTQILYTEEIRITKRP